MTALTRPAMTPYAQLEQAEIDALMNQNAAVYFDALYAQEQASNKAADLETDDLKAARKEVARLLDELQTARRSMNSLEKGLKFTSEEYAALLSTADDAEKQAETAHINLQTLAAEERIRQFMAGQELTTEVPLAVIAIDGKPVEIKIAQTQWGGWRVHDLNQAIGFNWWLDARKQADLVTFKVSFTPNFERGYTVTELNDALMTAIKSELPPTGVQAAPLVFKRSNASQQETPFSMIENPLHTVADLVTINAPMTWASQFFADNEE